MTFDLQQREHFDQDFHNLNMEGHSFSAIEFDACKFTTCILSSTKFQKCTFLNCQFTNCNLTVAQFHYCRFVDVKFANCKLPGIDWTLLNWDALCGNLQFLQCQLDDSSFYGLELPDSTMTDCQLKRVDFTNADFSRSNFCNSVLTDSIFCSTNLSYTLFSGAHDYNIDIRQNTLIGASFSRNESTNLLLSMGIELVD